MNTALLEWAKKVDGLFVGQLNNDEMESLRMCVKEGIAYYSYEGASGFLGLAKIRVCPAT